MATKTSKQKLQSLTIVWRWAIVLFIALAALLGSAQLLFNRFVWDQLQQDDTDSLKVLLIDALQDVSRDAPVEPRTGDVYLTEARLRLPAYPSSDAPRLGYSYVHDTNNTSGTDDEITLANQAALRMQFGAIRNAQTMQTVFDRLKPAQHCSRQFLLSFKPVDREREYTQLFSKKLSDGRTLYVNQGTCDADTQELSDYLRKIDSY